MVDVEKVLVGSKDEAVTKVLERVQGQKGWSVLPADEPSTATRGFLIFRSLDARGTVLTEDDRPWPEEGLQSEELWVQWPLFDNPLEPQVSMVASAKDLLDFAKQYPDSVDCSDPRKLLLGFAHYDPEQGCAFICQARLAQIKKTPKEHKAPFFELRAAKVEESKVGQEEAMKEAVALGAAIANRAA